MLDHNRFSSHVCLMPASSLQPPASNPESEWFGFKHVRPEEKTNLVQNVFASVAGNYDVMNDLMSGGLHRLWKDYLVRMMNPKAGQTILDVAGGTGDIALRCWKRARGEANITVCDLNPAMLEQGRAKAIDKGILPVAKAVKFPLRSRARRKAEAWAGLGGGLLSTAHSPPSIPPASGREAPTATSRSTINWITGNAEELPIPSRSIDTYSIAFGLRNVTRIDKALSEAARVLKPGGRFFCMEFSPGVTPKLKPIYEQYCLHILPWLGEHVAKDRDAYQYLAESILRFPPQAELAKRMEKAGLSQNKWLNLTGGIAVIHSGWKL
jgi:demethylmenaquinone methyltransferase / 2-methoxy-6-polyprenyl-1,4-benzoquinol methylase